MPTFVLIKEGREMERIQGANPQTLYLVNSMHYSSASNPNAARDREKFFPQEFVPYVNKILIPADDSRQQATDENGVLNRFKLAKGSVIFISNVILYA
ncbi:hypothetical protein COOONC_07905 [Cooperia oncophora]